MRRAYVLFLALVLVLTGCAGNETANDISVKDVCCPYEINHKDDVVEITLRDGDQIGILWRVETVPENICHVTQEKADKENASLFRLSGKEEGVAGLTFTALQSDEKIRFVLDLVVNVDAEGKVLVTSHEYHETKDNVVETDGLSYMWNVDANGILNFSFINQEDKWSVRGDGADVFVLSNMISTPSGCEFSAQAKAAGQTTIVLVGDKNQRTIHVLIESDDNLKMKVISVQEQ